MDVLVVIFFLFPIKLILAYRHGRLIASRDAQTSCRDGTCEFQFFLTVGYLADPLATSDHFGSPTIFKFGVETSCPGDYSSPIVVPRVGDSFFGSC